jgi:hypothetical protein
MKSGLFRNKADVPDSEKLKCVLQKVYPLFRDLTALTSGYAQEWKYYGKNYGWQYKVSNAKKALYYMTPMENAFRVTLGVREKERLALLAARLPKKIKSELETAKKHPEGYAVYLMVSDESSFAACKTMLSAVMEMRP